MKNVQTDKEGEEMTMLLSISTGQQLEVTRERERERKKEKIGACVLQADYSDISWPSKWLLGLSGNSVNLGSDEASMVYKPTHKWKDIC